MNWLLSVYTRRDPVTLRNVLEDLPKAAVWGLLEGPLIAFCFQWTLNRGHFLELLYSPLALFLSGVAGACFSVSFWFVLGVGNRWMARLLRDYPASFRNPLRVTYNGVGAGFALLISAALVTHIPGPVRFQVPHLWTVFCIDVAIGVVLAILIGLFRKLKAEVETVQAALRETEIRERSAAEAAAKAQALSLQAQINPHFFFNTLNTIAALIELDPAAARENVNRLADLFRYTLRCSQGNAVALVQELQFVRDYLEIEQARFQKRLRVEWPDLPLPEVQVPGLVMQPLVENAVKYGIAGALEGGVVRITVAKEGDRTRIAVANSTVHAVELSAERLYRNGHALENVRSRLRLFTGVAEPLEISQSAGWTELAFRI